jgi:hypothetical protein
VRSVAQLARGTADDVAQAARFESRAIELPLDQLGSRAEIFERRIAELIGASAEAGDLLERGIERALGQLVNEPLERYARNEVQALANMARPIQSGDVNLYLFYVFVVVVIAYAVYAT